MTRNIINQYEQRVLVFPDGTDYEVLIDVTGQAYTEETLQAIVDRINVGTNGKMTVRFEK